MGNCTVTVGPLMAATLAIGLVFGIGYNALVSWLEASGHDRGYTAFLVVGGCLATVGLGSVVAGLSAGAWFLACFAATGLPMVIGSWARNSSERKQDELRAKEYARELLHGTETNDGLRNEAGSEPGN